MKALSVEWQGVPLLTARPLAAPRGPPPAAPSPESHYRLSRFALLRQDGPGLLLESPTAWAQVLVHERRLMPLLHDLHAPVRREDLTRRELGLPDTVVHSALDLLHFCGLVCLSDTEGAREEDTAPAAAMWSIHELLFHARTRQGSSPEPLGKTYPFRERFPPAPALARPAEVHERIALARPDLARLREREPPLAAVLEARRSIRSYGPVPPTVEQLGELLFRTLRVRDVLPPGATRDYESSDRPLPSAGACHPLEGYLVVDRCLGLERGLYHYQPDVHVLGRLGGKTPAVEQLLRGAAQAAGLEAPPQVLLVLAARFGRVQWSYGPLAYSLILKDVGAAFQSLYLVATAMGLAPCGLGVGDSRLFAQAIDKDPLEETSVGEFLIGSRPELSPRPPP